jgi:hypothetical protein
LTIIDLLKKLIRWVLGKSQPVLESLEEERIEGDGVILIRYRRKTARAYRTWRIVYKTRSFDIIIGWDTLIYIPDVPLMKKKSRLSTHLVNIYKQGFHSRYNPIRGVNEPDIDVLLTEEVCMDAAYMAGVVQRWKNITKNSDRVILCKDDLHDRIIDEIAFYALRHPPSEIDPLRINWKEVVLQTVQTFLGSDRHNVFPSRDSMDYWKG